MAGRFSAMHLTSRSRSGESGNPSGSTAANGDVSVGNDRTSLLMASSPSTSSSHHYPSSSSSKFHQPTSVFLIPLWQRIRYRWAISSTGSKLCYTIVAFCMAQYVLLGTWDLFFYHMGDNITTSFHSVANVETTFAVAINTFKRPDMLRSAVRHYADTCGKQAGISQVFVIWAEQNAPVVPEPYSFFEDDPSSSSSHHLRSKKEDGSNDNPNRSEVYVLQKDKDSLNSRFEPIDALKTTAVLMVDDDLRVSCPSLVDGFQAWNSHPRSMVGYYPRLASPPLRSPKSDSASAAPTELVYHGWPLVYWHHSFNLVLTKASFLHSKYLDLYSGSQFPQEIRDYVDRHMNCEDIAMSILVANHTKYESSTTLSSTTTTTGVSHSGGGTPAPPIYVEGRVIDHGLIGGISSGGGHFATRSECLTDLSAILEAKGWGSPLSYQVPLRDYSWLQHAPGFWWQFRPSNIMEWFAFGNTFT